MDRKHQQTGLGGVLLFDAMARAARASEEMGICAFVVQALGRRARSFYLQYGLEPIEDDPLHLFVRMKSVRKLLTELQD